MCFIARSTPNVLGCDALPRLCVPSLSSSKKGIRHRELDTAFLSRLQSPRFNFCLFLADVWPHEVDGVTLRVERSAKHWGSVASGDFLLCFCCAENLRAVSLDQSNRLAPARATIHIRFDGVSKLRSCDNQLYVARIYGTNQAALSFRHFRWLSIPATASLYRKRGAPFGSSHPGARP